MQFKRKIEQEPFIQQVNIKASELIEMAVNGWFSRIEEQFHLCYTTASTTKSFAVLPSLPAKTLAKIPISVLELQNYEDIK